MRIVLPLLLTLLLSAAAYSDPQPGSNPGESFGPYPSIDDAETQAFVRQGLAYAIALYGEPWMPVNRVLVKYKPSQAFTQVTDAPNGIFTIFLSRRKDEYAFHGQLAHEIAHLLNAQVFDAYAEGLNTVFAEQMLKRAGKDWRSWEAHYRKHGDPFYAATYFMMKEVSSHAGADSMRMLLAHATPEPAAPERMYIDIDGWIGSLPSVKRDTVTNIILKHAAQVKQAMDTVTQVYSFRLPRP